jgi:hypothetical protein
MYYEGYNHMYGSEYGGVTTTNFVLTGNVEENVVNNIFFGNSYKGVGSAAELQEAVDNATEDTIIYFNADITGNVKITQKANVNLSINGGNRKYTGTITIFGDGRQSDAETLTIQNVNFVAGSAKGSSIVSPDRTKNNKYSYSHNVTIENCTFTNPYEGREWVAITQEDGGDKNWNLINCTVDETMHSFIQVNNVAGYFNIEDCKVYSKNGANFNSCVTVDMVNCEFNVTGYALRFGPSKGGEPSHIKTYNVTGCTLKSACNDGDAVIMYRSSAQTNSTLTLTDTTIVGATEISGNTADTVINRVG